MAEQIVQVEDVKKLYHMGDEEVWALKGISLDIRKGEFLSIMGPSGSGKSTLFNQIGALDVPTEGRVFFEGESVFELSESQQAWFRCNQIGYIFQTFNLIPVMSALQNVSLPMLFQGEEAIRAEQRATDILDRVGLGHRLHHKPFELSGGQQQRVAVARALANTPSLILADEPTGNLDTKTGSEIVDLLKSLNTKEGVTIVCSTHDPKMIASSDRICWILDGRLERISSGADFDLKEMEQN
ncbi:MAG: putative ABC transporter ATP-binding protein YknY [Candidatus Moanabacter tarae]|uniref:Putative ABC transporter ATP-binding protein YknY n=1 Tax=Candidatus Moanibacter tarae TaxID=2200854 RepID=A0A2Z4AGP0_9BACT|nr:MAG: putative ABC transporter ATP-binding protein YknY [Candidatus Moanabacter tarae]|tara:strand:+ start:29795 stop:30517 length:723 start_codon:yes stop_codon:yes gene_type:complete